MNCISIEDIPVTHDFIKQHINFILEDETIYNNFFKEFREFFLKKILSPTAFENIMLILNDKKIDEKDQRHLKNSLRRVFSNPQHYKGHVGEHLFAFYYFKMEKDLLWAHGPKGRSSAEPGIDFITFTGDKKSKETIKMTVWEAKTTENSITTRASQIYDFFSEDGSFEENIDSEITAILERFEYEEDDALKEYVADLYNIVVNRDNSFCIGASGISPIKSNTDDTFKKFAECFNGEISKEQRFVKFLFIELLAKVLAELRDTIWTRL